MNDWCETLGGLWAQGWATLAAGVADAAHPARRPTLATVSPTGWPEARTVVLRAADSAAARLAFHTDLGSGKIASLRSSPRVAVHVWDAAQDLQIRLQAEVEILSGAAVLDLWRSVPDHARQSYGVTPPPGTPIAAALQYIKSPDPAQFAVLNCLVTAVDLVHLGPVHRRACYLRGDNWAGQWLSP